MNFDKLQDEHDLKQDPFWEEVEDEFDWGEDDGGEFD